MPLAPGARVLLGDVLQVRGEAVAVRGVSLAGVSGARVLRSWLLVDPPGGIASGVIPDPPTGATAAQLGWTTRVPAVGAAVPARAERTVVLEVQRTSGATGAASGLHVDLAVGGGTAEVDSAVAYRFADGC